MRVGWVEPHLAPCGGIRRVLEISNRLSDRGHPQTIFLPEKVLLQQTICDWFPVKAEFAPLELIEELDLDVVVFNLEEYWELPLKSPAPVKVYYILHYAPLYKDANIARSSYQAPYKRLANSNWTANMVFLETGERPQVIHGGINPKHFYPVDVPKEYDLLCYGSPHIWKGTATIEEAARILGLKLEKYDGKGIPQEKMGEEYSKARIFVSGSWCEGWNQPGLEAMACGVPLVITDDGGSADYAKDGENCLVVPPRDPIAMAEAIKLVSKKKGLVKKGLETAKQFRWEKTAREIEEVFQRWLK